LNAILLPSHAPPSKPEQESFLDPVTYPPNPFLFSPVLAYHRPIWQPPYFFTFVLAAPYLFSHETPFSYPPSPVPPLHSPYPLNASSPPKMGFDAMKIYRILPCSPGPRPGGIPCFGSHTFRYKVTPDFFLAPAGPTSFPLLRPRHQHLLIWVYIDFV